MRTIVHLSDLHFGRVDDALLGPLRERIERLAPHLVVVSGDLTQRARRHQFHAAREYLDTLPQPQVVVPGNHDVPLYNVMQRMFTPLRKYKGIVTRDLEPAYVDDEIAVVGVNTARSLTFKHGSINDEQLESISRRLGGLHERIAKIVVTHHPFDVPEGHHESDLVKNAEDAMQKLARCGADILLAGHLHQTRTSHSAARYRIPGHSALIVQAGTATSVRGRGEVNSFNALHLTPDDVRVERWQWHAPSRSFERGGVERFLHKPTGWETV